MKRAIPLLILMSLWITEAVAQSIPPGPPTGLKVTAVGDRQVTLSWTPPSKTGSSDIRYYRIYYKRRDPDGGAIRTTTRGPGGFQPLTSFKIGISNFGIYTVSVTAIGAAEGPHSTNIADVEAAIPAPTAVTPTLDEPTTGDRTVTWTWTAPSPVVAPIIGYRYSWDGGEYKDTDNGTTPSQTITGLKNGRSYTFRVKAKRIYTLGAFSTDERATPSRTVTVTPLIDAPGTPGTLNVERVEDTAILTWSPPSDADEEILRYEYSDDGGSTWTSTGSTDTTYTVTGLEPGETYTFLVRAVYVDGGTSRIISPRSQSSNAAVLNFPKRRIIQECPVGWVRSDGFAGRNRRVLLYEVKLAMDIGNPISIYKPDWVAIYVHPDEGLENLEGWKLQVALPYNQHREYLLTAENSVVVDAGFVEGGFAFIENPEEDPFPMVGIGFTGSPAPGFDYRLYDETGKRVDFGISCYKRGDIFQVLKGMEDPRVLRQVLLETLDWNVHYLRSEWTVPMPAPAAPSLVKKSVVGTWAALKKQ